MTCPGKRGCMVNLCVSHNSGTCQGKTEIVWLTWIQLVSHLQKWKLGILWLCNGQDSSEILSLWYFKIWNFDNLRSYQVPL